MILTKKVNVKIINHNINHYRNIGYDVKYGDIININVNELTKGSHIIISIKCNKCGLINKCKYQDYIKMTKDISIYYYCQLCVKKERTEKTNLKKYGVKNVSNSSIIKEKKIKTNILNWGVENVFQHNDIKNKSKETCISKYGTFYPNQSDLIKNKSLITRIKNGKQININYYEPYILYKKKVLSVTRKYKKELINNWDGCDYYDGEYIKDNFNLNSNNKNYPTIDHKISIYEGSLNNLDFNTIGGLSNLCITKRKINSSKMNKNYKDFIKNNLIK